MSFSTPTNRAQRVLKRSGIARSRDLERGGLFRTQIRRLAERGLIERVGRGSTGIPARRPASGATSRTRRGSCRGRRVPPVRPSLPRAYDSEPLRGHGLTTQNPFEVWLAIDRKAWRPRPGHPPLRPAVLSGAALREGVEENEVDGVPVRVFSAAKTVADSFKFRNKIGTDVAIDALRAYRRAHPKRLEALWLFGEVDRVTRAMRPYLEAIE